jgi:hypothetical protein
VIPENFDDFIDAKGQMIGNVRPTVSVCLSVCLAHCSQKQWVEDKAAPHCLLCVERFTYSNRRHHCRSCGTLCCAPCSSKRLPLQLTSRSRSSSSNSNGTNNGSGDRVCDGCYNRLTSEATIRNIAQAKAKKELLLQLEREKEDERLQLLNGAASPSPSPIRSEKGNGMSSEIDGTVVSDLKETLGEVGDALVERGDKLQNLSRKGGELESVSLHSAPLPLD